MYINSLKTWLLLIIYLQYCLELPKTKHPASFFFDIWTLKDESTRNQLPWNASSYLIMETSHSNAPIEDHFPFFLSFFLIHKSYLVKKVAPFIIHGWSHTSELLSLTCAQKPKSYFQPAEKFPNSCQFNTLCNVCTLHYTLMPTDNLWPHMNMEEEAVKIKARLGISSVVSLNTNKKLGCCTHHN